MDDLRGPVVDGLRLLADDLVAGRYDDPHRAFVVLISADSCPQIVLVTSDGTGADPITAVLAQRDKEKDGEERRTVHDLWDDLVAANHATVDVDVARRCWKRSSDQELGVYIGEYIKRRWTERRDSTLTQALERAAFESSHPEECPSCHRRFTAVGLRIHQARARSQGCRGDGRLPDALRQQPAAPQRVRCPLSGCGWRGNDDERIHHLHAAHGYVVDGEPGS